MTHSFELSDAIAYGQEEAVLIQNYRFWILHNKANNRHQHDGRTWTYNSIEAFSSLFPYWTTKQIRRINQSLIDQGVIMIGNYNKDRRDRTAWYAFVDENGHLHLPKRENAFSKKGKPLPDIKHTDIKDIVDLFKIDGEASNELLISSYHIVQTKDENREEKNTLPGDVLAYLNEKAGTAYRPSAKAHVTLINARAKEGYTLADFKSVIDTKCAEWLKDAKMRKFLRPSTLFNATHFPEYLNQKQIDASATNQHEGQNEVTPHDEKYNAYLSWCKRNTPAIIDNVKHLSKAQYIQFVERTFHAQAKEFSGEFNSRRLTKAHNEMNAHAADMEKYKDVWTKFLADYDSFMKKATMQ